MYTKNSDGTITLDTGERISVSVSKERLANGGVAYCASATWIDDQGQPHQDNAGIIMTELPHTDYTLQDENDILKAMLLIILGEPQDTLLLSPDVLNSVNIRNHISASTSQIADPSTLL